MVLGLGIGSGVDGLSCRAAGSVYCGMAFWMQHLFRDINQYGLVLLTMIMRMHRSKTLPCACYDAAVNRL